MFIINLIKKLMGQAQEKVASSTSSVASAIDRASQKLDDYAAQKPSEATEDQMARETVREAKEDSRIHWQDRVTIGDKTYKTERTDGMPTLYESTDGGKHWTYVNALPLEYVSGLTVVDGKQLAIGGQLLDKGIWKTLKEEMQAGGAFLVKGDEGYDKVRDLQDTFNGWEISERAFFMGERGVVLVDPRKDSCEPLLHLAHIDGTMVVGSPSYTDGLKSVLKAAGQKGAEKVTIHLRKYALRPEVFFSLDGEEWHRLEGDMPKDFTGFEHYQNITVANTKSGKRYFYYDREWRPIDFEADLEFEDTDAPKVYKRLDVKEVSYHYKDGNNYKHDAGTTKKVHLLICDGEKGIMGFDTYPEVFYIANDHIRQDEFKASVSGSEIKDIKNIGGEVIITSCDKKKTYHEIFNQEHWRLCRGEHCSIFDKDDDNEQSYLTGPFGFESVILEDSPLWDKVDSPVKEYPLDAKGKEVAKTKKIIIKVPRKGGTGEAFYYLDKEGRWTLFARADAYNHFSALHSTGMPSPHVDKKGNIVSYNMEPLIYYAANSGKYFCWMRKKKGLFKKEIVYEWQEVNPVDMEMMGKVYPKG